MVTAAQHLQAILATLTRLPTSNVAVAAALHHAAAADIRAPGPLPRFDNSALDGYAVRAADLAAGAPLSLPVTMDIPAGAGERPGLPNGSAARIMTGARIPVGADTIVQVEFTDAGTESVRIERDVPAGTGVRRTGEDVARDDVLVQAGDDLTPARLGALASAGLARVSVTERPRVTVVATGAELVAPGEDTGWSGIHDSNALVLSSALTGVAHVGATTCRSDDPGEFATVVDRAVDSSDLVITTGGVSAGAYEVVKELLGRLPGFTFRKVLIQPGRPQGFGVCRGVPVLCFPGNPVSAYVSLVRFGIPAVRRLAGFRDVHPPHASARLSDSVRGRDVEQYLRGQYDPDTGSVGVVGGRGSHLIAALARANCLVRIPPGDDVASGAFVDVLHPLP